MINYPGTDVSKAEKVAKYISSIKRTKPEFVFSHCLDKNDVKKSLSIIKERWGIEGGRLFKHGVFSFGDSDMTPDKAVSITKEALQIYSKYPWLAAVHTNCPRRIHTHFLLGCVNLYDGSKFSQSKRELIHLKEHFNSIAKKYGTPLVRGYRLDEDDAVSANAALSNELICDEMGVAYNLPCFIQYSEPSVEPTNGKGIYNQFMTDFRTDMAKYFSVGYGREGGWG